MKHIMYFVVLVVLLFSTIALADRRNYAWVYQYQTIPRGATEMELYQTTKLRPIDQWEYRLEIEHGFTDRWDFSVYQIYTQYEGGAFQWEAVQFRTRYRIGEEGQFLMDPLLYFEYNRKLNSKAPNKIETRLILAKTISTVNLAINPVYEFFFAPGSEHELGLDMGMSVELNPKLIIGIESISRLEFKENESELGSYLGPTVSFASGNWWYTIGVGLGLTDQSDDARIRFLMGIEL